GPRAAAGPAAASVAAFFAAAVARLLPDARGGPARPRLDPPATSRAPEGNAVGKRTDRRGRSLDARQRGDRRPVPDDPDRDRLPSLRRASDPLLDRARVAHEAAAARARPGRR